MYLYKTGYTRSLNSSAKMKIFIVTTYRKRGKIRWAKHSRFQPYEVFRGNTFAVQWSPVFITYV